MDQSKKLLDRIKKEHIKPTPKWLFVSKNIFVWIAFILSVLIGAGAFSVILFAIQQNLEKLFHLLSHFLMALLMLLLIL